MINVTSILGTYEIGNPVGRNYSNNNLTVARTFALGRSYANDKSGRRERERGERKTEIKRNRDKARRGSVEREEQRKRSRSQKWMHANAPLRALIYSAPVRSARK